MLGGHISELDDRCQDDVDQLEIKRPCQVKIQCVLVLIIFVLLVIFNDDAEEVIEPFLHLISEVGLTRADDGQQHTSGDRGDLTGHYYGLLTDLS